MIIQTSTLDDLETCSLSSKIGLFHPNDISHYWQNHPHLDDLCGSQIIHFWNPTLPAYGRLSSLILKNIKRINRFPFHGLAWPLTPHASSQSALRYRLAIPRQTSLVMEPLLDHQETDYKKVDQPSPGASLMINVLIRIAEDSLTIHREGQQTKFSLGSFSIKVHLWTGHQGQASLPLIPPSK